MIGADRRREEGQREEGGGDGEEKGVAKRGEVGDSEFKA